MNRLLLLTVVLFVAASLGGCDNVNRSLVFFTNTNAGLDVGIDPSTANGRIVLGYKRQEGVLNPVYQPPKSTRTSDGKGGYTSEQEFETVEDVYRSEAYSVIAKIAGEARGRAGQGAGQAEASAGLAQWFATGRAAVELSKHPATAGAVVGSSEIAKAAAGGTLSTRVLSQDGTARAAEVNGVYLRVKEWAAEGKDPTADGLVERADTMANQRLQVLPQFNAYASTGDAGEYSVFPMNRSQTGFTMLTEYEQYAGSTVKHVSAILRQDNGSSFTEVAGDSSTTRTLNDETRDELMATRDKARDGEMAARAALTKSPEVIALLRYYGGSLVEPAD